jgi:hypothetical protein
MATGSVRKRRAGSVERACASGDQRAALEAMRAKLATAMDEAPPAVVAQVAARLQAVLAELAGLPVEDAGSVSDDLAERRAGRRAKAAMDGPT